MFGGNGSFGAAPQTAFGASSQAGPFQGSTTFGGPASNFGGAAAFGGPSTAFGGGQGGRSGPSTGRGGRTSARGGRSGGRHSTSGQQNNAFGGSPSTFGGPSSTFGGGRGRGTPASAFTPEDNPFAAPQPPSQNAFGGSFGQGGRGGRSGGLANGGRTTFGGGSSSQLYVRRKSNGGGRGSGQQSTTFGQPHDNSFGSPPAPPLPPSSPGSAVFGRKPGRTGIVTPSSLGSPVASQVQTTFGVSTHATPHPPFGSAPPTENPFVSPSPVSHMKTAFGVQSSSGSDYSAPLSRPKREKLTSASFSQADFQDESIPKKLEARLGGSNGRSKQPFGNHEDSTSVATTFGQQARRTSFGAENAFTSRVATNIHSTTAFGQGDATVAVRTRNKQSRAPHGSPSASPPPGSPVQDGNGMAIIGDKKNKAELSSAQNLDGTCIDMCSPAERELHIRVDELSVFEKCFPGDPGKERELIVKRFQRSSADHKLDIPSELRPPGVLRFTQLYLEQEIMDRELLGPDPRFNPPRTPELIELYNFCWDRCRMIRKDFVLQNYRGAGGRVHPIAIDVHERIARYHILSEHELCEVESFVAQQNMEQLGQTLKSLNELYDESRKLGDPSYLSPFEAEFRGYFILCTLDNGRGADVLKFVKGLPPHVRESLQVDFAMKIFVARHTQDYYQFFLLLRKATYLQACLAFRYIPSMRSLALQRMNRAYRNQQYLLEDIVELLCFDDLDHAIDVCEHHGLDISQSEDEGGKLVVNFGGDFETDIQLRQNKNPLPVRSSHVYVGQKQGDFLRRDVCRGVTEYPPDGYPMLSKLIEDTENNERSRLYPTRPQYEDNYSSFVVYAADPFEAEADTNVSTISDSSRRALDSSAVHEEHVEVQQIELDAIARRKAEVEQTKLLMMQRIQELEREKEDKKRQEELARKAEERKLAEAKARAEAEAARQAEEIEKKNREEAARLKEKAERELELRRRVEAEKAAAEEARLAELTRQAELKRAKEEAKKRAELQRQEEERRKIAAIEAERRRQAELAAEKERKELERQRRIKLAQEAARQKELRRIEKKRLAMLRLRFHMWKKFVTKSKSLPSGVPMEVSSFIDCAPTKPANVLDWLFGGDRAASDFIGLKRRQQNLGDVQDAPAPIEPLWDPLPVPSIVGRSLSKCARQSVGWKLVVADLLDEGLSSFGSWCAVKLGISLGSLLDDNERVSTVHSVMWSETSNTAICCRYLDASFSRNLSPLGQEKKLAATSAILLPLDLSHVLDFAKLERWTKRVRVLLAHLHPTSSVGLMVLGFCPSSAPRKGDALAVAGGAIRDIQRSFQKTIAFVDAELILEDDLTTTVAQSNEKIANALVKLTQGCPIGTAVEVTDLGVLLDIVVADSLRGSQLTDSIELTQVQDLLEREFWKLREILLSPSIIDINAPVPELQSTLSAPPYGWNSREAQQRWDNVFKALTSHRISVDLGLMTPATVCETYFERIAQLIDGLFASLSTTNAVSTMELKRIVYDLLVPVHHELAEQTERKIHDAARLLPWRHILSQIYGAFVESLDGYLLYVPTSVVEAFKSRSVASVPVHNNSKKRSRNTMKLDKAAQAAAVAFARHELKRSLSGQPCEVDKVNDVKRLRQEIARDRAESQSYRQFLRRQLSKWSPVDGTIPPVI